jgi:hypothetical protein
MLFQPHRFITLDRKKNVDEWCHKCSYVLFDEPCNALAEPTSPPTKSDRWRCKEKTEEFAPILERVEELRRQGLTGRYVTAHFLKLCISPLQCRSHPMWAYEGTADPARLLAIGSACCLAAGHTQEASAMAIGTLYDNEDLRDRVLSQLPACSEKGVVPGKHLPGENSLTRPDRPEGSRRRPRLASASPHERHSARASPTAQHLVHTRMGLPTN